MLSLMPSTFCVIHIGYTNVGLVFSPRYPTGNTKWLSLAWKSPPPAVITVKGLKFEPDG